jgi:aquaporin Z
VQFPLQSGISVFLSPIEFIGISSRMTGEAEAMRLPEVAGVRIPARSVASEALKRHWPEYLMEAAELGIFMVSACTFAALLGHHHSPVVHAIPNEVVRRMLMGCAMGLTAIFLFHCGWGRRSGAHMNPVVTLAFFRLNKIAGWDAIFYAGAQVLGGITGVLVARVILRDVVSDPSVRYAVTIPGLFGTAAAFVAEVVITFVLFSVVLYSSNSDRWSKHTALLAGILIALYIALESPISGMSMNPARTLGSALAAQVFDSIWIYFIAPPIGFLLAAELYVRRRGLHAVLCAKFHHDHSHRCIFHCGYMQKSMSGTQAG